VGETTQSLVRDGGLRPFSILERIDVGETLEMALIGRGLLPFSILERIDVGETLFWVLVSEPTSIPFSILERIDVGETTEGGVYSPEHLAFSILERIDVGETRSGHNGSGGRHLLSVSSNGSTWVKPEDDAAHVEVLVGFQYPRTDRRG